MVNLKPGDVIFVRGNSPISKAIQYFDKGEFSHVALSMGRNAILEAQYFTKSRIVPFYFKDYEIIDLGLTVEQQERVQDLGLSIIGKHYDFQQIFFYFLRGVLKKEIKIYHSPNDLICSELIDVIFTEIGVIPKDKYVGNVTPNEMFRYLKSLKVNG